MRLATGGFIGAIHPVAAAGISIHINIEAAGARGIGVDVCASGVFLCTASRVGSAPIAERKCEIGVIVIPRGDLSC